MTKKLSLKSIAPSDLWNILRGCIWIMLAVAVLVTGVLYAFALFRYTPMYSSTATMYLIGETDGTAGQLATDYSMAMRVMSDCTYLLKSRNVLNAVGERIGIKNGYGALRGSITITNPEDTRVLEITVRASTPDKARDINEAVCECGIEYINNVLSYDKLSVFEEATYNTSPTNGVSLMSYAKFGAIGAVLVYLVFLVMFLFDNYIHTEEDIERYLGLTILGDIPDADAPNKNKKYKYKYGKYGDKYKSYRYYKRGSYYKRGGYRYQSNYAVNPNSYADANAFAHEIAEKQSQKNKKSK